ncbi:peptidase M10 [Paraflavisolibacter sp. H34]|uniref:peptidase M10 n=1 Tax=Huijunlia imazamoxiresistens TaxID=3127457 RepID=UPI00301B1FFB
MGEAELNIARQELVISSHLVTYGDASSIELAEQMREEIETMWNEPQVQIQVGDTACKLAFRITAEWNPGISELEVYQNVDPRNNYFRIEEYAQGNISFVDGVPCNSGYFKLENLYKGSTTAAHEYGHTIGLDHPGILDIRGRGIPGIMYPRGTLVDPQFQYDPSKPAGVTGGTLHPMHRRVQPLDILNLKLHKLRFVANKAIVGEFTNVYHWKH